MSDLDVLVVGTGFSGIALIHQLQEAGFKVRAIERGSGVGGTWFWNRYPGARCDIQSLDYQYSDKELARDWTWSEKYATQPEILRYLEHAAKRWNVLDNIDFNTAAVAANWDAKAQRWQVRTSQGELQPRFLVMATGCLSCPNEPHFEGIEEFQGEVYHTGKWPKEGVDFTGQRVAVIGTGSSGIQSMPLIAGQAEKMFVLQRTPNFSVPAYNSGIDPKIKKLTEENWDELREMMKESLAGAFVLTTRPSLLSSILKVSAKERELILQEHWQQGGLGFGFAFRDCSLDPKANKMLADFVRKKIGEKVKDPELAKKLMPTAGYGCKRPCVDTNYFEMFNKDNVELVDIKGKKLSFERVGVAVDGKQLAVDAIVLATGFDAMTGAVLGVDIKGTNEPLRDAWAGGPQNYLGLQVAGFPNFFTCTGPGSPSVLSNMVVSIEQHVSWIVRCLSDLRAAGATVIEARPEAQRSWVQHVNSAAEASVFSWGCDNSWYKGANVPGKPVVFMPYAGGVGQYRAICDAEAAGGYNGFVLRDAENKELPPSMAQNLLATPRKFAYRAANGFKLLRMLLFVGGNTLSGAASPGSKFRSKL